MSMLLLKCVLNQIMYNYSKYFIILLHHTVELFNNDTYKYKTGNKLVHII